MLRQTWRWFGPADTVSISDLPQVGVEGVVSALHHIENGAVWSPAEIQKRKNEIERLPNGAASGVSWDVVESVPVSEDLKTKGPNYRSHIENYCRTLENLADAGIYTVCYNFMPVLDWTRTHLRAPMPTGASAMLFDLVDFIAFDLFILRRQGGETDYSADIVEDAARRFSQMDDGAKKALMNNIIAGLPGANDGWNVEEIREQLLNYAGMARETLRQNLIDFLSEVIPTAERLGIRMCCHPDDPPFSLLGLPRILSSEADYAAVVQAVESPSNGITICTGSLGVNPDFDGPGFVRRLGKHIHFAHLRNTRRIAPADGSRTSFYEAEHLGGDTDMIGTVKALIEEQNRRKSEGRSDWQIPMRPDHGQDLLFDQTQKGMPGYPLIGRMRGLAELRGVMAAVSA